MCKQALASSEATETIVEEGVKNDGYNDDGYNDDLYYTWW